MGLLVTLYLISANVYNSVSAPPGRGFSYIELWAIGMQFPLLLGTIHKLPKAIKEWVKVTKQICNDK